MGVRSEGGFSGNNEPRLRGMAFFRGGVWPPCKRRGGVALRPHPVSTALHCAHPPPEKGHTSKSGFIIFTKATFWTNSNWFRIWGWLIQNYPKLFRYLHKCRILCFFQWSPLCILAEIQMANWLNLVSCFTLFYSILLSRIRHLCKNLKSFG